MPFGHPGQGKLKSALLHITPFYVLSWSPPKYSSQGGWFHKTRFTVFAKRTHRHIKRIHYKKRHLRGCQKSETESWKLWVEFSRLGLSWVFWIDLCRERRPTFLQLLTTLCPTHLSPQQEEKLNHPGISCFSPTPRTPLSCASPIVSVWWKSLAS